MTKYSLIGPALLATALVGLVPAPVRAQVKASPPVSGLMIAPPTPDADALAAEMRVLAADPKNVEALTKAGELTLKLGDPTAAANLFARADKIEPDNAQLKADEAAVLVHMERPGEALRLFQQAVAMGADPATFAAERGLAYDLIGQQERAQRDYRLALKNDPDNAETMRRYALSLGISGQRKAALDEIDPLVRRQDHAGWRDRAFILAMTGAPDQAEKIAAAMLPAAMADGMAPFFEKLPGLSATDKAFAVHFGDLQVTPGRLADARMTPPLPPLQPEDLGQQVAAATPETTPDSEPKHHHKKNRHKPAPATAIAANTEAPASPLSQPTRSASAPIPVHVETVPSRPTPAPAETASNPASPSAPTAAAPASARPIATPRVERRPAPTRQPAAVASVERPAARVGQEDHILDNIMSGISASPSERESTPQPTSTPSPAATAESAALAAAKAKQLEAANVAAIRQAAAEKKAAEAAAAARRKAEEDKKAAAAKKAADEKAAVEKRAKEKEEKANPSRIWVQVAGGAYEGDLPKAWARVKAKAPEAFKGKTGWTTPLNATNRVLAGPFKSDDAAQDFINELAKKGLHAFPFTSDKGQKIDKLPAK